MMVRIQPVKVFPKIHQLTCFKRQSSTMPTPNSPPVCTEGRGEVVF